MTGKGLSTIFLLILNYSVTSVGANSLPRANGLSQVGGDSIFGEILAFVDVNYDRFTDLIVRRNEMLVVYLSVPLELDLKFVEKSKFVEDPHYTVDFRGYGQIINVAVGDFNGDSLPDLLVSTKSKFEPFKISVPICWGTGSGFKLTEFSQFNFSQQPMIVNCDDDPISDILAVELNGTLTCYLGRAFKFEFTVVPLNFSGLKPTADAAHGFLDITGDLNADLVFQAEHSAAAQSTRRLPHFQVWTRAGPGVHWIADRKRRIPTPSVDPPNLAVADPSKQPPNDSADPSDFASVPSPPLFSITAEDRFLTGRAVFDDLNRDGWIDLIVPVCHGLPKNPCRNFKLLVWSSFHSRWFWLDVEGFNSDQWSFEGVKEEPNDTPHVGPSALVVRTGDYNQNGYPDLLIVLQSAKNKSNSQAFFVENVPCKNSQFCADFGRSFRLSITAITPCSSVKTATFFDLGEDGTLDVLYECQNGPTISIEFTTWASDQDTTFLKVEAYTATCGASCHNGKEGTGISLPGASLSYRMIGTDGNGLSAAYTQQSCTTHKTLLLPYVLFGLGRSPNFVDKLMLGIPSYPATFQTWQQIVPNSRVYMVPYPPKDPGHWIGRLYVTPNRLIVMSASALGGVCLLIFIFISILQCCENRQDKKERDVLKRRFHFDAM